MNHPVHTEYNMQVCIQACSHCHQVCLQTAMNHCLNTGDKNIEPDHFRLLVSCAEICQTSANFQLINSHFHLRLCQLCAEVCEACAVACEMVGGMDTCAAACNACAESCRQMASMSDRSPISGFYPD
jgi:hypothetical protein